MTASSSPKPSIWSIVPAAGSGRRFGGDLPKQYCDLLGRPVLAHSLSRLLAVEAIRQVVVALHPEDDHWRGLAVFGEERVVTVAGGAERADSVLAALASLEEVAQDEDWVLVHDAARPCVTVADIRRLIEAVGDHVVGGLLASPVSDTLKRAGDDGQVVETVERRDLWRALTPQMFRFGPLLQSLREAGPVTDESAALERAGYRPLLVEGSAANIKITHRSDLALAAMILAQDA